MSERPKRKSADEIEYIAAELCRRLDEPDGIKSLCGTLDDEWNWDGYALAAHLDRWHCWNVDADMVETLNMAELIGWGFHVERVKEWVTVNRIKPSFAVGQRVSLKRGGATVCGTIVRVEEAVAQYIVKRDGDERGNVTGELVNYEDVDAA